MIPYEQLRTDIETALKKKVKHRHYERFYTLIAMLNIQIGRSVLKIFCAAVKYCLDIS